MLWRVERASRHNVIGTAARRFSETDPLSGVRVAGTRGGSRPPRPLHGKNEVGNLGAFGCSRGEVDGVAFGRPGKGSCTLMPLPHIRALSRTFAGRQISFTVHIPGVGPRRRVDGFSRASGRFVGSAAPAYDYYCEYYRFVCENRRGRSRTCSTFVWRRIQCNRQKHNVLSSRS